MPGSVLALYTLPRGLTRCAGRGDRDQDRRDRDLGRIQRSQRSLEKPPRVRDRVARLRTGDRGRESGRECCRDCDVLVGRTYSSQLTFPNHDPPSLFQHAHDSDCYVNPDMHLPNECEVHFCPTVLDLTWQVSTRIILRRLSYSPSNPGPRTNVSILIHSQTPTPIVPPPPHAATSATAILTPSPRPPPSFPGNSQILPNLGAST